MLTLTLHATATDKKLLPPAMLKKISILLSKHLKFKKPYEAALAFDLALAVVANEGCLPLAMFAVYDAPEPWGP